MVKVDPAYNKLRNDHPAKKRWVGLVRCAPRPFAGRYDFSTIKLLEEV